MSIAKLNKWRIDRKRSFEVARSVAVVDKGIDIVYLARELRFGLRL